MKQNLMPGIQINCHYQGFCTMLLACQCPDPPRPPLKNGQTAVSAVKA